MVDVRKGRGWGNEIILLTVLCQALKMFADASKNRESDSATPGAVAKRARKVVQALDPIFEHGASNAEDVEVVNDASVANKLKISSLAPCLLTKAVVQESAGFKGLVGLADNAWSKFTEKIFAGYDAQLKKGEGPRLAQLLLDEASHDLLALCKVHS